MTLRKHWLDTDLSTLDTVDTYHAMALVGKEILKRIPQPIVQVCGPVSTGGKGSIAENLKTLERAIDYMISQGYNVFDQTPFEKAMIRLKEKSKREGYPMELLNEFYLPLFESGLVTEFHFLPGWEESVGSRWEHEQAKRLGIEIHYLPKDWEKDILSQ